MKTITIILRVLSWICTLTGCLLALGAVGGLEHDTVPFICFILQELSAFGLFGISYFLAYIRISLEEACLNKNTNRRY